MKKFLAAIASFILIQHATAQSVSVDKVPRSVQTAFYTQFKPSTLKKWEVRKEGYIAVFKIDGKKQYAYYTHDGKWVATESRIMIRTPTVPLIAFQSAIVSATPGSPGSTGLINPNRPECFA